MIFWLLTIALSLLASLAVWRAWTVKLRQGVEIDASDNHHYETKIADIERDLSQGKIKPTEAEAAKAEAGRQLIRSQQTAMNGGATASRASGWWMTIALVFIPASSVLIYSQTGNPPQLFAEQQAEAPSPEMSVEQLVAVVEKRLEEFPDDVQGWRVIVPVYLRQKRYADAEIALRNILRIEGESPALLSGLGEVLVQKSGGAITEQAIDVFERALELESNNVTSGFYLGEADFQNGKTEDAIARWEGMLNRANGDEDWLPVLKSRIAAAKPSDPDPETSVPSGVNPEAAEGILALPQEDRMIQINAMVEGLAERLNAEPNDREGWIRLIQSYMVLGRNDDAKAAADLAKTHFSTDKQLHLEVEENIGENSKPQQQGNDG